MIFFLLGFSRKSLLSVIAYICPFTYSLWCGEIFREFTFTFWCFHWDLESILKISFSNLSKKASPNGNGLVKKKRIPGRHYHHFKKKSTAAGSVESIDAHLPYLDVHIKNIGEEHSFSTTVPEAETNGHEIWLPTEGQLLQMLASLQRQLDEQRAEAMCECEKAALKRDAMARVQNQLAT